MTLSTDKDQRSLVSLLVLQELTTEWRVDRNVGSRELLWLNTFEKGVNGKEQADLPYVCPEEYPDRETTGTKALRQEP